MSDALLITNLSKSFSDSGPAALHQVGLTLPAGSCTAVLGPSGSGKSTLLRVVAGLEVPDAGSVVLRGIDLVGVEPEKRRMAMVSQRPLLFPHLNVLDNIAFAATVRGAKPKAARADATEFLDLVRLSGFGRRPVTALSGGQAQRVAIARALAARPAVLLLDEPFSALDPQLRSTMHQLLARLREELAPTILMVTHDREEAASVAENIALLSHGRLLQHDRVEALYSRPASLHVHRLMGGSNEVPGLVRGRIHHSVLGTLELPVDTVWPSGPGTLVIRPESIGILESTDRSTASAVRATVTGIRVLGPRRLVSLEASGVRMHAEAPWGRTLEVGQEVDLSIPVAARAVVPGPPTAVEEPEFPRELAAEKF